ncbi:MAG TPA: glycosyltransferase [Candidatus Woesearchaeota archaeon]|nr:glycosyltransferase [Candidatus Woesearchaeota archaeon]
MDSSIKISIVIPAKNEEKYIKRLLDSLITQTYKPFEIIVADASSKDNTIKIAKKYNAIITTGGLPSHGRNQGAKIAKGDYIFFCDADTYLKKDFIEKCVKQIIKHNSLAGTVYNIPIYGFEEKGLNNPFIRKYDSLIYFIHNKFLTLTQKTKNPLVTGTFIFVKRQLFLKTSGFDESIIAFEDAEFAKRISKHAKFHAFKNPKIFVSTRRFDKKGRILFLIYVGIRASLGRKILGEKKSGKYF